MAIIKPQTIDGFDIPQLTFFSHISGGVHVTSYDYFFDANFMCYSITSTNLYYLIASSTESSFYEYVYKYYPKDYGTNPRTRMLGEYHYTYNNKTVYYYYGSLTLANRQNDLPLLPKINEEYGSSVLNSKIAWAMIYGEVVPDGYNVTYDLQNCIGNPENPQVIPPTAVVTNMSFSKMSGYDFNSASIIIDGSGFPEGSPVEYVFNEDSGDLRVGVVTSDIVIHVTAYGDPYQQIDGESEIAGGGIIGLPGLPTLSATSTGVLGLFAPSPSQMQALSDYMWTDFGEQGVTTEEILKEIVQAIKRAIANPLDYVTGLNIIPSQGLSIGGNAEIRFGFTNSGVSMPRLTSQYFTVDCGSLHFDSLCGDTFLDYAPYSKFSIYLPYIGVKEVDANDFVGHTIQVIYRGDVITGGVTAYILKDGSVMYQYSGCCALNVPLSADGWGSTISGAVQIATSIISGGISGGVAGASSNALKGVASVASNPSLLSPQVMRSGAVSGGAGCMGVQIPFVIREAVRFHSTAGFNTINGYPSYYYKKLSSIHGFTTVLDVHLNNINATVDEVSEIETKLKSGVIF